MDQGAKDGGTGGVNAHYALYEGVVAPAPSSAELVDGAPAGSGLTKRGASVRQRLKGCQTPTASARVQRCYINADVASACAATALMACQTLTAQVRVQVRVTVKVT